MFIRLIFPFVFLFAALAGIIIGLQFEAGDRERALETAKDGFEFVKRTFTAVIVSVLVAEVIALGFLVYFVAKAT